MIATVFSLALSLLAAWLLVTPLFTKYEFLTDDGDLDQKLKTEKLYIQLEELEQQKAISNIDLDSYKQRKEEIVEELTRYIKN